MDWSVSLRFHFVLVLIKTGFFVIGGQLSRSLYTDNDKLKLGYNLLLGFDASAENFVFVISLSLLFVLDKCCRSMVANCYSRDETVIQMEFKR
jgi:hypothetical protein